MNAVWRDAELRRYLLGELLEPEQTAIDAELWAHGDATALLGAAEDDLIDDYVAGRLAPDERSRFEGFFLSSPRRKQRLAFARSLSLKLAEPPARLRRIISGRSPFLALAATLLLAAAGGWLLVRERALGEALRSSEAQRRGLARDAAVERAQVDRLTEDLARAGASAIVSWRLTPGSTRGAAQGRILALDPGVRWVRLSLRLEEDRYPTYRVSVQTIEGRSLATITGLRARAAAGPREVECMVPAELIPRGSYVLLLSGDAPGHATETVDSYTLYVG
jgi:hypothetical protein